MAQTQRLGDWLETHWFNPAYSGWVLGGLSLFFFIAATNTLSGWLYVLSGAGMAIVGVSGYLSRQSLTGLTITRLKIDPVSAGDPLAVTVRFTNQTHEPKVLLQAVDQLPIVLGEPVEEAIALIPPQDYFEWNYTQGTQRRGIYRWETLNLRTASPFGLLWYRRAFPAPGKAIVYPTVLPLGRCPLIDDLGKTQNPRIENDTSAFNRPQQMVTEITRTLRPYRWGDPMRFIHWRTSARYGELRVRELEVFQGGQSLLIALDSHWAWSDRVWGQEASPEQESYVVEAFEQAVIAAASLYFYAQHLNIPVQLWTAEQGVILGKYPVLEALAAAQPGEPQNYDLPLEEAVLWLSQNPASTQALPGGSRWLLWAEPKPELVKGTGKYINTHEALGGQLSQL
ncbi:MAG: DUF58 domain-containing protein [Prochlorotrichaceae cyanobacterium]|jgi:uncharacterized protein (DUF58 family)